MIKYKFSNGAVIEGTVEELMALSKAIGSEELAEVAKAEPATLKVGDYAKITGSGNIGEFASHQFGIGEIVVVTEEARYCVHKDRFRADKLDGSDYWFVHESFATRATDEEVAEAKAELARKQAEEKETARWASIGRSVNEFKKGDIVRGKRFDDSEVKYIGVVEDLGNGLLGVHTTDNKYHASVDNELITPVEARFDQ